MRRTWVAFLAIVLGAGAPAVRGEPPAHLPPAPEAVAPPAAVPGPAPDLHPGPAAGHGCPSCNACRQRGACLKRLCEWAWNWPVPCYCDHCDDAGHVHCFRHGCGGCNGGCCYKCFPPLYLWFLEPHCVEGHPHTLPCNGGHGHKGCKGCGGCASCANGHAGPGPEAAPPAPAGPPVPAPPVAAPGVH